MEEQRKSLVADDLYNTNILLIYVQTKKGIYILYFCYNYSILFKVKKNWGMIPVSAKGKNIKCNI